MYSFNEVCLELLIFWRSIPLNDELRLRSVVTSNIHRHINVLSKQLIWIDNVYNYIDQTSVILEEDNKLLLIVLRKLTIWIKNLKKMVYVPINLFNFN